MNSFKIFTAAFIAFMFLTGGAFTDNGNIAFARDKKSCDKKCEGMCDKKHSGEGFLKMLKHKLDLTDDQYKKISDIVVQNGPKRKQNKELIKKYIVDLEALTMKDSYDEAGTRKILENIDAVKRENRLMHIKTRFEIQGLLSPEQDAKFKELMKKKFEHFHEGFNE